MTDRSCADDMLDRARDRLYAIAGGSIDSGNVRAARITTEQRMAFFRSSEFLEWVAAEKAEGREVFWLKDVDKTQGAGDIFTFFFKWRADNGMFTRQQLRVIEKFLLSRHGFAKRNLIRATRMLFRAPRLLGFKAGMPDFAQLSPYEVLRLWQGKEEGGEGIGLYEFWSKIYWPSQVGLTRDEKWSQVRAFATHYASKVYPGVPEENRALEAAGVNVVIVSNGDQELAIAAADILGIKPENVVGSHLIYDSHGKSTGINHSYEVFGEDWLNKPQPGKPLSFHYWIYANRARFGWRHLDHRKIVIAGMDGDSAANDGGMMILLPPPAIGNFMVDTPNEPERILRFYSLAAKYGWTWGQFFTLVQNPSHSGRNAI